MTLPVQPTAAASCLFVTFAACAAGPLVEEGPHPPLGGPDGGSPPSCVPSGPEACGNGVDDDCDPSTTDACARTCADVGGTEDGVYPLELGGRILEVYCDLDSDGGAWALVANAPAAGYDELAVVSAVDPTVHGRLSDEDIYRLLARPSTDLNNVRARIGTSWVVSMRATLALDDPAELGPDDYPGEPSSIEPQTCTVAWTANGDCAAFDEGPDEASIQPSTAWHFANGSSGGSIGFSEIAARSGQIGFFYTNYDTGVDLACNRMRTDGAWQPAQAGSLWIR